MYRSVSKGYSNLTKDLGFESWICNCVKTWESFVTEIALLCSSKNLSSVEEYLQFQQKKLIIIGSVIRFTSFQLKI